jgi:O-antigen/teichoic acid export membrane protein
MDVDVHNRRSKASKRDGVMVGLRARTFYGLGWSGTAQVFRQLLQFATSVVLARLLSPQEFGLIGMIVVFTGFASLFTDLGLGAAIVQKLDLEERHLSSAFWVSIAVGLLLTGLTVAVAPLMARFYDEPDLEPFTRVIAFNFLVGSVNVVQNALLLKNMDFRLLFQIEIVATGLAGLAAIGMAFMGFGVWSLVVQSLLITAISVGMMWWLSAWRPTMAVDIRALKELLGFSSNLLGFNVLNYWVRNLDNFLIGKFIGPSGLGIYTRAYSLMLLPITQVTSVVSRVMFPALSAIQKDVERVRHAYLRSTQAIALVTFPMMIGLLVVAEPFVLVVYGEMWSEVIPILRVFCLIGMGQSIGTTVGWIYTSQGRADLMLKWGIFSAVVYAISFIIGLRWGVMGVAVAYGISGYVILWYPAWAIPGRLINLRFKEMLINLRGPFYCAVAMGIGVWAVRYALPSNWPQWLFLVTQVPSGVLIYGVLVHFFRIPAYVEIQEVLFQRTKRRLHASADLSKVGTD